MSDLNSGHEHMSDHQDKKAKPPGADEADASYLFGDPAGPGEPKDEPAERPGADEGYEVEGLDEVEDEAPVPPVPVVPTARKPRLKPERAQPETPGEGAPKTKSKKAREEESAVSQPWSRGAEWGLSLVVVAAALAATVWATYSVFSPTSVGLTLLVLVGGLVATLVLAYPIFITLERPVRMTPEQALKDFYGALSHRRPHYKRMWLLLSDRGKESEPFDGFGEFRAYWRQTLAELKAQASGKAGMLTFSIADFKSEKSAGQTVIDGTATVQVKAGPEGAPVAVFRGKMWFVKGPDRMWYMNQGTLPDEAADRSP